MRVADFSALSETGAFYLDVAGVGTSDEFDVAPDVYARAFLLVSRAFYGQRCGMAVDLAPLHPGYAHPACHVAGTPNPDALLHSSAGATGTVDGSGGWHDAGDYGKYVVNSGISTGELLWAYELFPERVGAVSLQIPESNNGVPDLLDEARWNLRWMLKMQDADGGVWHKLTSERFGGFVMPEKDDGGPRYVIGTGTAPFKSSCATGDFAAVMAIAARVFQPFDAEFAATARAAAERAWRWLSLNPNVVFRNCCGVSTGEYGDGNCSDERLWAAAELFRTTGAAEYDSYFKSNYAAVGPVLGTGPPSWPDVRSLALFSLRPVAAAHDRRSRALTHPRGRGGRRRGHPGADPRQPVSHQPARERLRLGLQRRGRELRRRPRPRERAPARSGAHGRGAENLHYLLGRNTFALSWVTQLGDRPYRHPHHRPSGGDANAEPWPGMLSGGPNRFGGDPVIDALPATPPARRYRDDQGSYASNEMAINWNAPLVFLLASLLPDPAR